VKLLSVWNKDGKFEKIDDAEDEGIVDDPVDDESDEDMDADDG